MSLSRQSVLISESPSKIMRGLGATDPGVKPMLRTADALLRTFSAMTVPYPLKPVFAGLPRADEHGRIIGEPASA